MPGHGPRNPAPRRRRRCHIAGVADMGSAAGLIGAQIIGAKRDAILFGDEHLLVRAEPIGKRIRPAHVAVERIGLARPDHRHDDPGDRGGIARRRGSDLHGVL